MPSKKRQVVTNVSWLVWEKVFQLTISFFLSAWIARYLGPEKLGVLSNILAFMALLSPLATLALDNIAIERIIDDESKKDTILGTSFLMKVLGTLIFILASVILVTVAYPSNTEMTIFMFIASFGLLFRTVETVDFWFQANVNSKYSVITRNLVFAISSVIRVILVLNNASLLWFVVVVLIEALVSGVGMFVAYKISGNKFSLWKFDKVLGIEMLKESWPLIISGLAVGVFLKVDQLFIGRIWGSGELGVYSVAVKFTELWNFIPSAIVISVFPFIIRARKDGSAKVKQLLFILYAVLLVFSCAVGIFFLLFSGFVVNFFYGEQYLRIAPVLQVYIWTLLFSAFGTANARYLIMIKKTGFSLFVTIIGALIAYASSYYFVRFYGIMGGALASLLSYGVVALLPIIYVVIRSKKIFSSSKGMK